MSWIAVIRYFDLFSEFQDESSSVSSDDEKRKSNTPTFLWLLSLYLALALGVFREG